MKSIDTLHPMRSICTVLCTIFTMTAFAQTRWIGPANGDWTEDTNWDGGLPDATRDTYVGHSGGDSPVSAVIGAGVVSTTQVLRVGDNTIGTLTLNGDMLRVEGNLLVGARSNTGQPVGEGAIIQNAGTVYLTSGSLQLSGANHCTGQYTLNTGTLDVARIYVFGNLRTGIFEMADGATLTVRTETRFDSDVTFPAGAILNITPTLNVPYSVANVDVTVHHLATNIPTMVSGGLNLASVSDNLKGTYLLDGGVLYLQHMNIATRAGGQGTLRIVNDGFVRFGNNQNTSTLSLGNNGGQAVVVLGDAISKGWLNWTVFSTMTLRLDADSHCELRGIGGFQSGTLMRLVQNGRVIADAWGGAERDLDLRHITTITNSVPNAVTESNGWFAVNGARLLLPPATVSTGNTAVNWGEHPGETNLDLVNSVRFAFDNVTTGGGLTNALLAVGRSDIPQPDKLDRPVAVHHVTSDPAIAYDELTLTFRYDGLACAEAGYAAPVVLHSTGGGWTELPATLDTETMRISVSVPSLSGSDHFAHAAGLLEAGTILILR